MTVRRKMEQLWQGVMCIAQVRDSMLTAGIVSMRSLITRLCHA